MAFTFPRRLLLASALALLAILSSAAHAVVSWEPTNIAETPGGSTQILWEASDGAADLWRMSGAGVRETHDPFPAVSGWRPVDLATDSSGNRHLLWTHSDGRASFWNITPGGSVTNTGATDFSNSYGPYNNFSEDPHYSRSASFNTVCADDTPFVGWLTTFPPGPFGEGFGATVWELDGSEQRARHWAKGYLDWKIADVDCGGDNSPRLLWQHTGGQATILSLVKSGSQIERGSSYTYGPFADWTARQVNVDGLGNTLLLWQHTNGQVNVWRVAPNGLRTASYIYGPYAGWTVADFDAAADGSFKLLWTNGTGLGTVWHVNALGTRTFTYPLSHG